MLGPHQKALLETGREVSRQEWRDAKSADLALAAEQRAQRRPFRTAPRRYLSPAHTTAAMAELMATRAAIDGSCSERDLAVAGFSTDEITRYGSAAQMLAAAITRDRVTA